jgi:enoyl-CoA hydratase/carnithine racemase
VNTIEGSPSANGKAPEEWSQSWTHFGIDRHSPGYCRVTFEHPPINAITSTTVSELAELVTLMEQDPDLNVVVFDSANPDFYLAHYDTAGPTGMHAWPDLLARLSRVSVLSIASIRGRVRGAGSEFVLACDLRFASRENALIDLFEVGSDVAHGGGSMARLSGMVGRGRALEVLLVADDLDGRRAEQYGCINRAVADEELDSEVEAMAERAAGLDHDALARAKSSVAQATPDLRRKPALSRSAAARSPAPGAS